MAISAQFTADFTQWKSAFTDAVSQVTGLRGATVQLGPDMQKQAQAAGQQIKALAGDVTSLATKYVQAYAEEEKATRQLITALQQQGRASDAIVTDYQEMAAEFQKTTKFADDAVIRSTAVFTAIGKVGPENMREAMTAAANLASFMGTDLESAATMVAKAFGAGGESLGALKKILGDTVPKGADMAAVMEAINSKFGGQAAADMETTSGKLENLKNNFGDVEEKVGGLLLKGLTPLMEIFMAMPEPLQTIVATVGVLGTALAPIAIAFGSIVTAVTPLIGYLVGSGGLAAAFTAVGTTLAAIALPAAAVIAAAGAIYLAFKNWDAIVDIVSGVYNAIKTYLVDKFNALLSMIRAPVDAVAGMFRGLYDKVVGHSYIPDMIDGIQNQFDRLPDVMVKPAQDAAKATDAAMKGIAASWAGNILPTGDSLTALALNPGSFLGLSKGQMVASMQSASGIRGSAPSWLSTYLGADLKSALAPSSQGITVNVAGNILGTQQELANLVGDAVVGSYRSGGNRLPA